MGVPECSRITARRAPSSPRALPRKAASPSRSVRAVESTMSANRMTVVPEGRSGAVTAGASPSPRNSSMAASTGSMSTHTAIDVPSRTTRRASGIWEARLLATSTGCQGIWRRCSTSVGGRTCGSSVVTSNSSAARRAARYASGVMHSRMKTAKRCDSSPEDHPNTKCDAVSVNSSQSLSSSARIDSNRGDRETRAWLHHRIRRDTRSGWRAA